jgi:glycosyltransferase involved in cell wall biosynthesis
MRIVVVNNFFPPRPGGSSHLSDSLAVGYAAAGHEVLVLTASYRDCPAAEERDGVRIVRLPAWVLPKLPVSVNFDIAFTARPGLARQVEAILAQFQPDVIHQHGQFFDLTWASGLWARKHKVPVLLSVHTRLESPRRRYRYLFRVADTMLVYPILRRYRPDFVVIDTKMDAYISARYRKAVGGRVNIPVGVEAARLRGGDGARIRARHDLGDRPVLLSLGHVIPLRARLPLARALPRILDKIPDLAVVVVGHVYHGEFLKLAEQLGVRHAVIDVGAVPKYEVPDYLAAAMAEVHDLEGHGLGTASLESMAAGIPVIASVRSDNFPGIRLGDREHLYAVPLDDPESLAQAIVEIASDPDGAKQQVAANAQRLIAEHFTMESVTRRHLAHFETMVKPTV